MANLDPKDLSDARDRLLDVATDHFCADADVLGLFVSGSLAAGSFDAYSDIDLRVVVRPERHGWFVQNRRNIPMEWPGFLFNEWMPGTRHCVSHFAPFNKIDIFYLDAAKLMPSPWYRLPVIVLHDPEMIVAELVEASRELPFTVTADEIDISISKGIAAAHETFRRAKRGELFYAQTLLDELRHHMMLADDWLHERTAETTVLAKFDRRGSADVLKALGNSYCALEADKILTALRGLVANYRLQVQGLHAHFKPRRPIDNDLAALDIISQ